MPIPPYFRELRRRCAAVGVTVWWFDADGRRVASPRRGTVPAEAREAAERAAAARSTGGNDRLLLLNDDGGGLTVAHLPAGEAWAAVVTHYHADLARAEADARALDTFSAGLSQSYEQVSYLFRLARLLNAPYDPVGAVDALCRQLLDAVPFGWVSLHFRSLPQTLPELAGRTLSAGRMLELSGAVAAAAERCCDCRDGGRFVRPRVLAVADADPLATAAGADVVAAPVAHDDGCVAVLLAGNRHAGQPEVTGGDAKFLGAVADLLGVFHENLCRFAEQRAMSLGTVRALANAIDAKDAYTRGHSERVALLAAQLAAATGADAATVERYRIAGLIHDVGKIGVPEAVLTKPGRLTDEEFRAIQRHPTIGVHILQDVPAVVDVLAGVLHHHERYDGRGYPARLAGDTIPHIARVLALADTFDAMSSTRSYRSALPRDQVLAEIVGHAGSQFDPDLAAAFVRLDFAPFDALLATAAAAVPLPPVALAA